MQTIEFYSNKLKKWYRIFCNGSECAIAEGRKIYSVENNCSYYDWYEIMHTFSSPHNENEITDLSAELQNYLKLYEGFLSAPESVRKS